MGRWRHALRTALKRIRPSQQLVDQTRAAMLRPGFCLVRSPWFFNERLLQRLPRRRLLLRVQDKLRQRYPELAHYGAWLAQLLLLALPEEEARLVTLEYRYEPAGSEDEEVDRLHADGSYIRAVYNLCGSATVYRHEGVETAVPASHTLLMTAQQRTRARRISSTLHRRPGAGPERAVLVCSFEPAGNR
jgi:hypothetical protein